MSSSTIKKLFFSIYWGVQAASYLTVSGFGVLPYCLAGAIALLLIHMWVLPDRFYNGRFFCFVLIAFAFGVMFGFWAFFFGSRHPMICVLGALVSLLDIASCWLIKPDWRPSPHRASDGCC